MIKLNGTTVDFQIFPNGESFADMPIERFSIVNGKCPEIFLKFENDKDLFYLSCVRDYVDNYWPDRPCKLIMPYIPYSRMDRQEENRLFTLKTFAKMINSMNFSSVEVWEPHSEVSVALIDRVKVKNTSSQIALYAIRDILDLAGCAWFNPRYGCCDKEPYDFCLEGLFRRAEEAGIYLVYPDAGAEKRYRKQIKYSKILTCSKERDFNTGKIKSIEVHGIENAQDCKIAVIVDDLSSKGGTFVGAAQVLCNKLSNIERVVLCVTHCENTIYDGDVLKGTEIDKVYTTKSILTVPRYDEVTNFDKNKLVITDLREFD